MELFKGTLEGTVLSNGKDVTSNVITFSMSNL